MSPVNYGGVRLPNIASLKDANTETKSSKIQEGY